MSDTNDNTIHTNTTDPAHTRTTNTSTNSHTNTSNTSNTKVTQIANKCETHSQHQNLENQEMQQTDCDIQRDQHIQTTPDIMSTIQESEEHTSDVGDIDANTESNASTPQDMITSEESTPQTIHRDDHNLQLSRSDDKPSNLDITSNSSTNSSKRFNIKNNKNFENKLKDNFTTHENSSFKASGERKAQEENDGNTDKYKCPVCDLKLDSQHTFTVHIRQHNPSDHSHTCRLCGKTLSSASSLDRHMLIHSGERPFKCRICNMAFTTNGNMHRHMRTHGMDNNNDDCNGTDTNNSCNKLMKSKKRKASEDDNREPPKGSPKRRNSDVGTDLTVHKLNAIQNTEICCPICKKAMISASALHSHMEAHPNEPICCRDCGMIVNNYATYTQHRCTGIDGTSSILSPNRMNFSSAPAVGFYDLSFTDFTSRKFSMIAKTFCEHNLRKASSPYHEFECDKCKRAFPCASALHLHESSHHEPSHDSQTYCRLCQHDFITPALFLSHQMKHRFNYPMVSMTSSIPQPLGFKPSNESYGDVPHSDKEDFLALLDLQNKGSQMNSIQSNYKFTRSEDSFENNSYYIHAKPLPPPRSTPFQSKVTPNGTESDSNKHDLADIQSIISVTRSAAPLMSSIRSSPPAASPASPVHLGVSGAQPDSPVAADSANASPNTPSISKTESDEKLMNEKPLSIVTETEDETRPVFKCNKCSLSFKTTNALKRHNRGHTQGGHSYACHLCPYTSLDKSTLVRHLRTHNGERPFQCSICKYAFTTKANCERHVRKRHKKSQKQEIRSAMQYNPNMSTATALSHQNLTKTESNPVLSPASDTFPGGFDTICKYCNVDFKFNRVLRHHLRSLHNSCSRKPYCCSVCKLGFSTKNNCIRHVVKQHPEMKDKLSSVVFANSSIGLNSDHSESESLYLDSPELSSHMTKESINMSTDNSMNGSLSETSAMSALSAPQHHSSLAALCQIAKNISSNHEKPMNLVMDSKSNFEDDDTDCSGNEDEPLNLAPHSHEEQPLDLAVHALDLSCKSSYPTKDKSCDDMKVNEAVRTAASSLLALRSMTTSSAFPTSLSNFAAGSVLQTPLFHHSGISLTPPLPAHSTAPIAMLSPNSGASMEDIYKMTNFRISKNRLLPRNERSFTCIYCSAGFTLKSNMERHIKRKHPEFARPPRSRGVSSATHQSSQTGTSTGSQSNSSLLSKSNNTTLSNKTRAALRVVLNNKVMGTAVGNSIISGPSSPGEPFVNNMNLKNSEENSNNADNTGDLASVSSLIDHSANSSNALKQYFNKQSDDIEANVEMMSNNGTNETKTETIRPNDNNKSMKSLNRKSSKEWNSKGSGLGAKKRSAYTDSPNSVSCPYCARKFPWTSSLRRHILTHTGLKPYKCPKCPILFTTKSNCERHLIRKHNGREKRSFVEHTTISLDSKPYKCNVCPNSTFTTHGNLKKHYYLRHWSKTGKQNNILKNRKEDIREEEVNETNVNKNSIQEETGDDRLNFTCYLCETSFNGRLKCLKHIQSCHSNEYHILQSKGAVDKVPVTDTKPMPTVDNQNDNHEEYESYSQQTILCVFCPRQFTLVDNLRRHMRVHLGERPFKCMLCTKRFSLKNSLLRHHRTNHPESELSSRTKTKSKQPIIPSISSTSLLKETDSQTTTKAVKSKGSCNSLLYLIPKDSVKQLETFAQNSNIYDGDHEDGSDLIQNLLGLQDSKILDDLLDSGADSAARILGVKDLA